MVSCVRGSHVLSGSSRRAECTSSLLALDRQRARESGRPSEREREERAREKSHSFPSLPPSPPRQLGAILLRLPHQSSVALPGALARLFPDAESTPTTRPYVKPPHDTPRFSLAAALASDGSRDCGFVFSNKRERKIERESSARRVKGTREIHALRGIVREREREDCGGGSQAVSGERER